RRRHTRFSRDWSSDVCSSDLAQIVEDGQLKGERVRAEGVELTVVRPMPGAQQVREIRTPSGLHYLDVVQGFPGRPDTYLRLGYRSEERRVGKDRTRHGWRAPA